MSQVQKSRSRQQEVEQEETSAHDNTEAKEAVEAADDVLDEIDSLLDEVKKETESAEAEFDRWAEMDDDELHDLQSEFMVHFWEAYATFDRERAQTFREKIKSISFIRTSRQVLRRCGC